MIGDRLHELRTERGMSLRALAEQAGVSPTLLSQIERGVTEPSLSTLRRLAGVFGASIASLFEDPAAPSVWISRPGERTTLGAPNGQIRYERLTPGNGQLEVLHAVLAPGEVSSDELWSHPSLECVYVVAGTLTVQVERATYTVAAGESLTLDSNRPHRYLNTSDAEAEIVLAINPPTP
ncbi:MerR family transcriptional regulator [Acrocarpospora phusangensis]|uniref:MerR family transcriptional regulator n=1 Tax=Acrocarpospora phusangensis TaxID=1070424 RepID=A0A919UL33_9ACTN|nr:cupin domain-containing protein [Acrocarpospora phusangensis]GIH21722.1 MerR family transcriptional regulator [Acrocarpospora phusangensis]